MVIVIIGVSGSGKTTIGRLLARNLGWHFLEGDDFHSEASVAKMRAGIPLEDADRWPWLAALREQIVSILNRREHAVLACSALKRAYRDILRLEGVQFVYPKGDYELIHERLKNRKGHFFDERLLVSQFDTLEEPQRALVVDTARAPEAIATEIVQRLNLSRKG
jgi:gluconokinase